MPTRTPEHRDRYRQTTQAPTPLQLELLHQLAPWAPTPMTRRDAVRLIERLAPAAMRRR